jgi:hypothetical protein
MISSSAALRSKAPAHTAIFGGCSLSLVRSGSGQLRCWRRTDGSLSCSGQRRVVPTISIAIRSGRRGYAKVSPCTTREARWT